jgi:hypothetical protein
MRYLLKTTAAFAVCLVVVSVPHSAHLSALLKALRQDSRIRERSESGRANPRYSGFGIQLLQAPGFRRKGHSI